MKIFRTTAVINVSRWDAEKRIMFEVSPAMAGATRGQPKAGDKRFDYDKGCRLSFKGAELLTYAYQFIALSQGAEGIEIKKFVDKSKSAASASDDSVSLNVKVGQNGGIFVGMSQGKDKKVSINIGFDEVYAIGRYLEFAAQDYFKDDGNFQRDDSSEG